MSEPSSHRGAVASIRAATPADAEDLAHLIDRAGEGIPAWLWSRAADQGETALDVGRRRATRPEGGFSYRNARIIECAGHVAGMLLGYRLPDPFPEEELAALPAVVRPMLELEAEAPGSWYVNAIAVYERYQGRGYGRSLLRLAESLAQFSGAGELSLIVAFENERARSLYERMGYEIRDRRPIVPIPGLQRGGDWVLMIKGTA